MDFPSSYPALTWVIMGGLGSTSSIVFSVIIWKWIKSGFDGSESEPISNYTALGYILLFASGLFACGIAGPPGYALSDDPGLVSKEWIFRAAAVSNILALLGWLSMYLGQKQTIKFYKNQVQNIKKESHTKQEILEVQ